jgi:hypothetical protein
LLVTAVRGSGGRGHRIRLLAYCCFSVRDCRVSDCDWSLSV